MGNTQQPIIENKNVKKRSYLEFPLPQELNIKIISYIDLHTLVNNIRLDGSIRPLVYQAMPSLLVNNLGDHDQLIKFIKSLGNMGQMKLLKRAIVELEKLPIEKNYLIYLNHNIVIELLRYDPSTREIIYNAIPSIVKYCYLEKQEDLNYLMRLLIKTNISAPYVREFKLMKRLIEESIKIHPINYYGDKKYDLYDIVIWGDKFLDTSTPTDILQKYLELEPNYHWNHIGSNLMGYKTHLSAVESLKYYIRVLDAAIGAKSINILKYFRILWNIGIRQQWIDTGRDDILQCVAQMDFLIEQAKTLI